MRIGQFSVFLSVIICGFLSSPNDAHAASDAAARCGVIRSEDFSGVLDALTQVTDAKFVEEAGAPAYCQVGGYVAPSVGFLLRLPAEHWNGKFIEIGCGGWCGTTAHIVQCDDPLRRGYACIVSDGGHRGGDVKWAFNNPQAKLELAYHAPHVTALAGKAIVERYYELAPQKSYFTGCSGGGSQAMWEAQRFPWDFDGIIAGAPALDWTAMEMNELWGALAVADPAGRQILKQGDLEILHRAVVAKCDLNDGVKDGLIGDPRACNFDPAELACAAGKTQCLTDRQIDAVKKIYAGPVTSKGQQIALPAALKGSEQTWLFFYGDAMGNPRFLDDFLGDAFRYSAFQRDPGPSWKLSDFNFDRDSKRLEMFESMQPVNPDLRRFKAAGGKLLAYTGWADAIEVVPRTVDYYQTVERVIGTRASTQEFFRLFVVPGMSHCGGGEGASAVDYLSYLEAWVEKGQAPEKLLSSHVRTPDPRSRPKFPLDPSSIEFSRPVYPYPIQAKYLGHGDPNDAASFGPAKP